MNRPKSVLRKSRLVILLLSCSLLSGSWASPALSLHPVTRWCDERPSNLMVTTWVIIACCCGLLDNMSLGFHFGMFRSKCFLHLVQPSWSQSPAAIVHLMEETKELFDTTNLIVSFSVFTEWLLSHKRISTSSWMLKLTVLSKHLWKQSNRMYLSFVWTQQLFARPILSTVYFFPKMLSLWTRASKFRHIHWVKVTWKS